MHDHKPQMPNAFHGTPGYGSSPRVVGPGGWQPTERYYQLLLRAILNAASLPPAPNGGLSTSRSEHAPLTFEHVPGPHPEEATRRHEYRQAQAA